MASAYHKVMIYIPHYDNPNSVINIMPSLSVNQGSNRYNIDYILQESFPLNIKRVNLLKLVAVI